MTDLTGCPYPHLLTRRVPNSPVNDLDVLVRPEDFSKVVNYFVSRGYQTSSHDQALGGRIPGAQINLTKPGQTKIDLHQDFTWRKSHHLDLDLVWAKTPHIDEFLVLINVIFEKTYLLQPEYQFLTGFTPTPLFESQAEKHGWVKSYQHFLSWWSSQQYKPYSSPVFLPVSLVLSSYIEKFEPISLLYYIFFRTRYAFTRILPYD